MSSNEIELRGPIDQEVAARLHGYLTENGANHEAYHEVALFFNADHLPSLGSFQGGVARLSANQKRYADGRVTQVAKMKIGSPTGTEREEYEIPFAGHGLRSFFEMLKKLGISEASFRASHRADYALGDLVFTTKIDHPIGHHYEIETGKGVELLHSFLDEHGLHCWSEEEFKEEIMSTKHRAPYMPFEKGMKLFEIL